MLFGLRIRSLYLWCTCKHSHFFTLVLSFLVSFLLFDMDVGRYSCFFWWCVWLHFVHMKLLVYEINNLWVLDFTIGSWRCLVTVSIVYSYKCFVWSQILLERWLTSVTREYYFEYIHNIFTIFLTFSNVQVDTCWCYNQSTWYFIKSLLKIQICLR